MGEQTPLFVIDKCRDCGGTGCATCKNTGEAQRLCRLCDRTTNGEGSYCDHHDPATVPIPF